MKQIIDGFEDGEADDGKWHSILISVNQMMVFKIVNEEDGAEGTNFHP